MLAPARPSPTRAGVICRKRSSVPVGAVGGFMIASFGRDRSLAQPDRIVRCVLLTARGQARELDQMVRDHRRADQALDVTALEPAQREFPECFTVVAEYAHLPEDIAQHDEAAPDIGPA